MDKHRPPGQQDVVAAVVKVPGVEEAINKLTVVIASMPTPPSPGPPTDLSDLVDAIKNHALALRDNTVAIREHAESVEDNTDALGKHTDAIKGNTEAIQDNSEAILVLAEALTPPIQPKATRITMTTEIEPEGSTPEESMEQFHPNQKFKATFRFNGPIDGEPVIVAQGGFTGASAQDPKEEKPATDDPSKTETFATIHIYCTEPAKIIAGKGGTYENHPEYDGRYMISLPCTATVDDPNTEQLEKIHEPFEFVAEWIPATQQKATAITMPSLEVEP